MVPIDVNLTAVLLFIFILLFLAVNLVKPGERLNNAGRDISALTGLNSTAGVSAHMGAVGL